MKTTAVSGRSKIKTLYGNLGGLKSGQIKSLERLYRKKVLPSDIISNDLLKSLCGVSRDTKRQIGLLINRQGRVAFVIAGSAHEIVIPRLSDYRVNPDRLRGLRLIHTHLDNKGFTADDLTDLAILRLDLLNMVEVLPDGTPGKIHTAHIRPEAGQAKPWNILKPGRFGSLEFDCTETIRNVEDGLSRFFKGQNLKKGKRALLVTVTRKPRLEAEEAIQELVELAKTNEIHPVDTIILRPHQVNRKYLMGEGQLKTLVLSSLTHGADTVIFNENLTPVQARELSDYSDLLIMDRTQLILEIFGTRALSSDGKTKVELAQLKYALPRLSLKDDSLSRIRGGIGLKGPGETKLEIGRRRVQDRISVLERKLKKIAEGRVLGKRTRLESGLPLISIVGYTNSGKSTLFNLLTKSDVYVENKLFATLDTKSRLLFLNEKQKAVISDTVGFIRDLPEGLLDAFRSTLEELNDADLLIHLADISSAHLAANIMEVDKILRQLNLSGAPVILVLNKCDNVSRETARSLCKRFSAIPIAAEKKYNISSLVKLAGDKLLEQGEGRGTG